MQPGEKNIQHHVAAVRTDDLRGALLYFPSGTATTLDLSNFAGPVKARWFDPTTGRDQPAADSPFAPVAAHEVAPPSRNAAGDPDWVLVLESP
jgi:hypothetical protein